MVYESLNQLVPSAPPSESELRELMCEIGRRIWQRGLCAGNDGNHSVRLADGNILCTPTGMSKGFMRPHDMVVVDLDGNPVRGQRQRTSEIFLHLAIFKARRDVNAVIHNHPPHATAFALSGIDLPTGVYPEAEALLGKVHTAPYVLPGDKKLGESVLPFVKDANTLVLQNHGVVCFDADLEQCYQKLEVVDQYARICLLLRQIGSARMLSAGEMADLLALKARLGWKDSRSAAEALSPASERFFRGG